MNKIKLISFLFLCNVSSALAESERSYMTDSGIPVAYLKEIKKNNFDLLEELGVKIRLELSAPTTTLSDGSVRIGIATVNIYNDRRREFPVSRIVFSYTDSDAIPLFDRRGRSRVESLNFGMNLHSFKSSKLTFKLKYSEGYQGKREYYVIKMIDLASINASDDLRMALNEINLYE